MVRRRGTILAPCFVLLPLVEEVPNARGWLSLLTQLIAWDSSMVLLSFFL